MSASWTMWAEEDGQCCIDRVGNESVELGLPSVGAPVPGRASSTRSPVTGAPAAPRSGAALDSGCGLIRQRWPGGTRSAIGLRQAAWVAGVTGGLLTLLRVADRGAAAGLRFAAHCLALSQ